MPHHCNTGAQPLASKQKSTGKRTPALPKKALHRGLFSSFAQSIDALSFRSILGLRQKLFKPAPEVGEEVSKPAVVGRLQILAAVEAPDSKAVRDRPAGVAQLHLLRAVGKWRGARGESQYRLGKVGRRLHCRAAAGQNNTGREELVFAYFFEM